MFSLNPELHAEVQARLRLLKGKQSEDVAESIGYYRGAFLDCDRAGLMLLRLLDAKGL